MDLHGAIDLHVHTAPDVYERSVDDVQLAEQARKAGMRAVLLKSHHTLTADRATIAGAQAGFTMLGGLALNYSVGGINPVAVETAIAFGARQIWMPTIHAGACLAFGQAAMIEAEKRKGRVGLHPFGPDGEPSSDTLAVLEQVRDADIALGSGHLAPDETLWLFRIARDMGVRRLLVTHPLMAFTRFAIPQMKEAASLGAKLEFDALSCNPRWLDPVPASTTADAIRAIGAEHCVIATDGGQAWNPPPVEILTAFAQDLRSEGLRAGEIRTMLCDNPAWLLGL